VVITGPASAARFVDRITENKSTADTYLGPRLLARAGPEVASWPAALVHAVGAGVQRIDVAAGPLALDGLACVEGRDRIEGTSRGCVRRNGRTWTGGAELGETAGTGLSWMPMGRRATPPVRAGSPSIRSSASRVSVVRL